MTVMKLAGMELCRQPLLPCDTAEWLLRTDFHVEDASACEHRVSY